MLQLALSHITQKGDINESILLQLEQIKKHLETLSKDRNNEIKSLKNEINFYKQLFVKMNECLPFMNGTNILEKILNPMHQIDLDIFTADLKLALHRYSIENTPQLDFFNVLDSL